ncbi:MAG: transcriptional regulator [Candidatus Baldrarchaeia archaeon]
MESTKILLDIYHSIEDVKTNIKLLHEKLDLIIENFQKKKVSVGGNLDVMMLLDLPDHLRKTAIALSKLGKATAEDLVKETGRSRAVESCYLNQLERMGYIAKERKGRKTYFYVG